MNARKFRTTSWASLAAVLLLTGGLAGCEGDDGKTAWRARRARRHARHAGYAGLNCWDLNQNGVPDLATEDLNGDGVVDVLDCRTPTGAYDPVSLHKATSPRTSTRTSQCLNCHGKIGDEVMTTGHWKWEGVASNIAGFEVASTARRTDQQLLPGGPVERRRCTQCHIGIGWKDKTFDFGNAKNLDCLVCHDQTGTYKKARRPPARPTGREPDRRGAERRPERRRAADQGLLVLPFVCRWRRQRQARRHLLGLCVNDPEYDVHLGTTVAR